MSNLAVQPECFNSPEEMRLRVLQVLRQTEARWRPVAEDFLPWVAKLQGLLPMAGPMLRMLGADKEHLTRLQPLLQYLPQSLLSWETDAWRLLNLIEDEDLLRLVAKVEGVSAWVLRP